MQPDAIAIATTRDVIEKSEHPGIILSEHATLDAAAAAAALMELLERQGKRASLLTRPNAEALASYPPTLAAIFTNAQQPAREFIISIDTNQNPVARLRYEKEEGAIQIILSPKLRPLTPAAVSFRDGNIPCDCAIIIGVPDVTTLAQPAEVRSHSYPHADFFSKTPLINIDNAQNNTSYGDARLLASEEYSLSQIIYSFAAGGEPAQSLTPESATFLLAGIIERTNTFRAHTISSDSFLVASSLMRLGADYRKALSWVYPPTPLPLLQLMGRASVRSKIDQATGALWCFLTQEDFEKTNTSPRDIPRVLSDIEKTFPPHPIRILVWHDSDLKQIRAVISGDQALLERIRAQAEGRLIGADLHLTQVFAAFPDAEQYLRPLFADQGVNIKTA